MDTGLVVVPSDIATESGGATGARNVC